LKETVNLILTLKKIYDDRGEIPGEKPTDRETPDRDERNRRVEKLNELRQKAKEAIEASLSRSPTVSSSELSDSN
jgi:hypothetical protein